MMPQAPRTRIDSFLTIARSTRAIEESVRSWTGRSALSAATETALSHLMTSGTYQTRVSAMRAIPPRNHRSFLTEAPVGSGAVPAQRRQVPESSPRSG